MIVLIYLTYLPSQTKEIALSTSAIVLPLRIMRRVAKEMATIDQAFS